MHDYQGVAVHVGTECYQGYQMQPESVLNDQATGKSLVVSSRALVQEQVQSMQSSLSNLSLPAAQEEPPIAESSKTFEFLPVHNRVEESVFREVRCCNHV